MVDDITALLADQQVFFNGRKLRFLFDHASCVGYQRSIIDVLWITGNHAL